MLASMKNIKMWCLIIDVTKIWSSIKHINILLMIQDKKISQNLVNRWNPYLRLGQAHRNGVYGLYNKPLDLFLKWLISSPPCMIFGVTCYLESCKAIKILAIDGFFSFLFLTHESNNQVISLFVHHQTQSILWHNTTQHLVLVQWALGV